MWYHRVGWEKGENSSSDSMISAFSKVRDLWHSLQLSCPEITFLNSVHILKNVAEEHTRVLYSLYGVVEHSGTMRSGHYTAYAKTRTANTHLSNLVLHGDIPQGKRFYRILVFSRYYGKTKKGWTWIFPFLFNFTFPFWQILKWNQPKGSGFTSATLTCKLCLQLKY